MGLLGLVFPSAASTLTGLAGVTPAGGTPAGVAAVNAFRRSLADKWLGGVCAGIGQAMSAYQIQLATRLGARVVRYPLDAAYA